MVKLPGKTRGIVVFGKGIFVFQSQFELMTGRYRVTAFGKHHGKLVAVAWTWIFAGHGGLEVDPGSGRIAGFELDPTKGVAHCGDGRS
jgi:hypothetical protein